MRMSMKNNIRLKRVTGSKILFQRVNEHYRQSLNRFSYFCWQRLIEVKWVIKAGNLKYFNVLFGQIQHVIVIVTQMTEYANFLPAYHPVDSFSQIIFIAMCI